jgi:hypothetical protein
MPSLETLLTVHSSFQNLSWDSDVWIEYISFLNQRHSLELEALELYEAITTLEAKRANCK